MTKQVKCKRCGKLQLTGRLHTCSLLVRKRQNASAEDISNPRFDTTTHTYERQPSPDDAAIDAGTISPDPTPSSSDIGGSSDYSSPSAPDTGGGFDGGGGGDFGGGGADGSW